jgi:hypothetical protein
MVNVRDPPDHNQRTRRGPTKTLKNPLLAVAVTRSYDRHRRPRPSPPLALIAVLHRLPFALVHFPLSFFVPFPYILSHSTVAFRFTTPHPHPSHLRFNFA